MDEVDFSDNMTYIQQEDFSHDGDIPPIKICNDYNFTSENDILDVSHQTVLTVDDPQENTTQNKTCRNADLARVLDKIIENTVNKIHDTEKQCTIIFHMPPNKGNTSKSNISDILLNHLSKEEFLRGQGIDCETLPEISNADSFDEAIIKNVIFCYVKNSCPEEQTSEADDQLNPERDGEGNTKPNCSPIIREENLSDLEEPVVTGCSSHQRNPNFLAKTNHPSDKQKSFQGLASQKQQTEKSSSGTGFKYGQGQVHYQFSDFSKVASKVKIPKNNIINEPLRVTKQNRSSDLKDKSALVQDLLETMPRTNCVEKHQEQIKEAVESSQQIQMEPMAHIHQERLTGIESDTSLFQISSASQEDSSSSSSIFQKIIKGKHMCQKLKEQTDQLKAKVQDFSKRIAQDSAYSQNKRPVLEKLQGHLELLEQEFLTTKEKHLTLQQQDHKHISSAVGDFDPERKVEGEIFKLEMLLEDFKEKIDEHKYTSSPSLLVGSPVILDDLVSISSPPVNEIPKEHLGDPSESPGTCESAGTGVNKSEPQEAVSEELHELDSKTCLNSPNWNMAAQDLPDQMSVRLSSVSRADPNSAARRQECAETTAPSPSCAFCHRALERKQKMEKRGHRRIRCGRFSIIIQENPLDLCSSCSSDSGGSFCSDSRMGLQSNQCENCGAKISNSRRVSGEELPKACSKPKRICSQRANMKPPQGEHEPMPEKKELKSFMTYSSDLATPSAHAHSRRIYGSKSLCDFRSTDKKEFEILNSALDHALRTATVLKETTDQMIKSISEDLAKARKRRNQLKY